MPRFPADGELGMCKTDTGGQFHTKETQRKLFPRKAQRKLRTKETLSPYKHIPGFLCTKGRSALRCAAELILLPWSPDQKTKSYTVDCIII